MDARNVPVSMIIVVALAAAVGTPVGGCKRGDNSGPRYGAIDIQVLRRFAPPRSVYAGETECRGSCKGGECTESRSEWLCVKRCRRDIDCPRGQVCACGTLDSNGCFGVIAGLEDVCVSRPPGLDSLDVVHGAVELQAVRRAMRRHSPEVEMCFESEGHEYLKAGGTVAVLIGFARNGRVESVDVDGNGSESERVGRCIGDASRSWDFPRPTDGETASVRAVFRYE